MKKIFLKRLMSGVTAAIFVCLSFSSCGKDAGERYAAYEKQNEEIKQTALIANGGFYNYDLSEYIKVPEYRGVNIPDVVYEPTEEEIINKKYEKLAFFAEEEIITDGTVEKYDLVVADYTCYVDGLIYSGMSSSGDNALRNFMAGVSEFEVPEIDNAIIGMAPGDTKDIEFTFPTPYYKNVVLSGKTGKFSVTLETIRRQTFDEYNDEFVSDHFAAANTETYDAEIYNQLVHDHELALENYEANLIWEYLLANVKVEKLPQKEYSDVAQGIVNYYTTEATDNDMSLDDYVVKSLGYETVDAFRDSVDSFVMNQMTETMTAYYIARCEGIYVTDSDYSNALASIGSESGASDISYLEQLAIEAYGSLNNFRQTLLIRKVDDYLTQRAVKINSEEYFAARSAGKYVYDNGENGKMSTVEILIIVLSVTAGILFVAVVVVSAAAVIKKKKNSAAKTENAAFSEKKRGKKEDKKSKKEK